MERCDWGTNEQIVIDYHDHEWGVPIHDDQKQFEYLMMEVMQCGLNWTMMLKKRDVFRQCFDNFDFKRIAEYSEGDVERMMNTEGMIRSPRKIHAVIGNAQAFLMICKEYGSFDKYLWNYSGYKTILYKGHDIGKLPTKNELSDVISKDLKKRGFKYLGSITIYSHLQACGIINDHNKKCECYKKIVSNYPIEKRECAGEE